jgi:L-gulonate 5-dehydrogenase
MDLACPAGRVVVLGLKDKPSDIAIVGFTKKELDVIGSRLNNYCFGEVIELFESGKVTPEKLSTHQIAFTDAERAIKLTREHPEQVCKVTLSF